MNTGRLAVETVEKLLAVARQDILSLKNCGDKTTAKIMMLQKEYGKDIRPQKEQETIDSAVKSGRSYMNRLIVVAMAANEMIEGAVKDDRYYFRVTKQRFNALKLVLKALRETKI